MGADERIKSAHPVVASRRRLVKVTIKKLLRKFGLARKDVMIPIYDLILRSGIFDNEYYISHNRDLSNLGVDPLQHYLDIGWKEQRNPNSLFDTQSYIDSYPDVEKSGINPLVHYLRVGGFIGRDPSSRFNSSWYLEHYPDVREAGLNPLAHYILSGLAEGRVPQPITVGNGALRVPLSPYENWMAVNRLSKRDIAELQQKLDGRAGRLPKISIVTPVHDTSNDLLTEMIESVLNQIYDGWELCLINDASQAAHIAPILERYARKDSRIRVRHLAANGGISVATNAAVAMAHGEIVVFLDHDDLLSIDCLAEIAVYYSDHPNSDMVYSDDDKIAVDGTRYAPQFKPDWSPVLLLSWMYIGHVFSVRKTLFEQLGGFRREFDGAQDYDFALRAAEKARHVGHVPKILYHWRAADGSTATGGEAKPSSLRRGMRAVQEALNRRGLATAKAIFPDWAAAANVGMFDVIFVNDGPSVTIVIPTRNQLGLLKNCLKSLEATTYTNFDILIVDNVSDEIETQKFLDKIDQKGHIRVVKIASPGDCFNFAQLINDAVSFCSSDFVLFLNNDTQIISPIWLSQMMGYAQMPGVGAVGARLYFEDGTLQHAGIVHGYHDGLVGHAFRGLAAHNWGYLGFVRSAREYSAVTAACLLTPRKLFIEIGGFDEKNFAVAYNDVDYCYRLVVSGRTCVYCADAELRHYEGKSRGFNDNPLERSKFRQMYRGWVDRWYNPNLSLENEMFEPASIRPETASTAPVNLAVVTHNLNNEGAPTTLLDLVIGLTREGLIQPTVLSPVDGPLRLTYEKRGIRVIILENLLHGVKDKDTQAVGFAGVAMLFRALEVEVVLANTLQSYWAIEGAKLACLPSILAQHESEPWENYFDDLLPEMRAAAYQAFEDAYRVLYVAEATLKAWRPVERRHNFKVIRHGIPPERMKSETSRWSRSKARKQLGVPHGAKVLSVVGTVCRRKGQLDLVKAYAALPANIRATTFVYIAGMQVDPEYVEEFLEVLGSLETHNVILTDHIEDPFLFYAASDVFICTSRVESAPRVIVEAMACGLPIITTPVFGIPELVQKDVNALYYEPGDYEGLAQAIKRLLGDDALRKLLGVNGPKVLGGQPGYGDMIEQYGRVIRQAVNLAMPSE